MRGSAMRWVTPLLVTLMMVPMTFAQDDGKDAESDTHDHGIILEDGSGDIESSSLAGESAGDASSHSSIDLVGLSVEETERLFIFTLQVADLQGEGMEQLVSDFIFTYFEFEGVSFRIESERYPSSVLGGGFIYSRVEYHDEVRDDWRYSGYARTQMDVDADTVTIDVDRQDIFNEFGARPHPGRSIDTFWAESYSTDNPEFTRADELDPAFGQYTDRMPDDGTGSAAIEPVFGIRQTGHAFLRSMESIRASNGEAATFVFSVEAHNLGEKADLFEFEFLDVPAGWDVRMASTKVRIDGEESKEVPIIVRTPKSHQHGVVTTFLAEMHSLSDPSAVGRIEMGLDFLEIPQPAGHHPDLYLHSYGDWWAYMNANETDARDSGNAVEPEFCWWAGFEDESGLDRTDNCWEVRLDPRLQMGLDFDLDGTATFDATFSSALEATDATLEGRLMWRGEVDDDYQEVLVASFGPTDPQTIPAQSEKAFSAEFTIEEDADLLTYSTYADLTLGLRLTTSNPSVASNSELEPHMEPGGKLHLPLFEYSDPIDEVFGADGALSLIAEVQEKEVNPGETVLYDLELTNEGAFEDAFLVSVHGPNEEWSELLTERAMTLPAGESHAFAISVDAPEDAPDGERSDIIVEAASSSDDSIRTLIRLLTTVDTDNDHEDESGRVSDVDRRGENAPGVSLVAGIVLLALVAWRRRR